jgi:YVTN family beta-propeller protein
VPEEKMEKSLLLGGGESVKSKVKAACATTKVRATIAVAMAIVVAVAVTVGVMIGTPKPSQCKGKVSVAYVVNSGSNVVSVIATDESRVMATIPVGASPNAVAVTPDGTRAYVTNLGSSTVSVIDTVTNSVLTTFSLVNASMLRGVAISPDGTRAYVVHLTHVNGSSVGRNAFSAIDTVTHQVIFTIQVGSLVDRLPSISFNVVVHPDGTRAYLTGFPAGLLVIDTVKQLQLEAVRNASYGIAIAPDGTQLYLAPFSDFTFGAGVSVINTTTNQLKAFIPVPSNYSMQSPIVAVSPDGKRVYLASYNPRSIVTVIDTATNLVLEYTPIDSLSILFGVAVSADGTQVYVTDGDHTVFVIDAATNKVMGDPIPVGSNPGAMATAWIPC